MKDLEFTLQQVSGVAGDSLTLVTSECGGYRIAGPKPWGGGEVTKTWKVRVPREELEEAIRFAHEKQLEFAEPDKHISVRDCVDRLEKLGSDQDPIVFRRRETTPRNLSDDLGDDTMRACAIRVSFWGDRGLTHSNLRRMLVNRVEMARRGEIQV